MAWLRQNVGTFGEMHPKSSTTSLQKLQSNVTAAQDKFNASWAAAINPPSSNPLADAPTTPQEQHAAKMIEGALDNDPDPVNTLQTQIFKKYPQLAANRRQLRR